MEERSTAASGDNDVLKIPKMAKEVWTINNCTTNRCFRRWRTRKILRDWRFPARGVECGLGCKSGSKVAHIILGWLGCESKRMTRILRWDGSCTQSLPYQVCTENPGYPAVHSFPNSNVERVEGTDHLPAGLCRQGIWEESAAGPIPKKC